MSLFSRRTALAALIAPLGGEPGGTLIGTRPPEWQATLWMGSPPLKLADLRGRVVLVRWWTAGCPYCSATAPALRAFHERYAARGLTVVGMYHHKEATPFQPEVYRATARKYGFTFPVAVDTDWRTLRSWLRGVDTGFTSVTFVLDKEGIIRHLHRGGEYRPGDAAETRLRQVIEGLL
jgi:peroxiredoxin